MKINRNFRIFARQSKRNQEKRQLTVAFYCLCELENLHGSIDEMPNGNKRRPDTLELEVLRTPAATKHTDSQSPQRPPSSTKPRRYAAPVDAEHGPPATFPKAAALTRPSHSVEARPKRWYHFGGGMFSRKASTNTNTNTTTTTSTANLEAATATLAKPEPSTIDNSTATILTMSPHNAADDNLPDVAAVLPRQQQGSFKRRSRKSRSDSLYSLATLAQTGEVQLHSRSNSCTKFKDKEAEIEAESAAAAALMYENGSEAKDKILLTSCRGVTTTSVDNVDEITDNLTPEAKSGLRANLMSFLGKLGIWKNSNCRPPRKRSSPHSKHTTPSGYSAAGPSAAGLAARKSVNLSGDFEQFPDDKSGRLATAKEIGKRRLSQIRRRRSSYYFSGTLILNFLLFVNLLLLLNFDIVRLKVVLQPYYCRCICYKTFC